MQFTKSFLAVATMVLAVAANPIDKRTTPAQGVQQQCGDGLVASCCNTVGKSIGGLLGLNVGIGCVVLDLLSVLPINQLCSQQVACCQSGPQSGFLNVAAPICPIVL